jgi:hypothetical protein
MAVIFIMNITQIFFHIHLIRQAKHTYICLELYCDTMCIHLPLKYISSCPNNLTVNQNFSGNFVIQGIIFPKLVLETNDFKMFDCGREIFVPNEMSISIHKARKINKILQMPFECKIGICHNQVFYKLDMVHQINEPEPQFGMIQ